MIGRGERGGVDIVVGEGVARSVRSDSSKSHVWAVSCLPTSRATCFKGMSRTAVHVQGYTTDLSIVSAYTRFIVALKDITLGKFDKNVHILV